MLPDRVSNPGPLTYESGALPIALRGSAPCLTIFQISRTPPGTRSLPSTKEIWSGHEKLTNGQTHSMVIIPVFAHRLMVICFCTKFNE